MITTRVLILFLISNIFLLLNPSLRGQDKIDIGIFESPILDTLVIKARPNYNLASPWYITNIQLTIRWPDTSNVTELIHISSTVNSTFGLNPQQYATNGGYRYQVHILLGQRFVNWTAGEEYPILEVVVDYPGGDCTEFEISADSYTIITLNGAYYFEVVASDKTGIRYEPLVSLATKGGNVTDDETICLGSMTGVMTLAGHSGSILTWQEKFEDLSWQDIAGTAGLTEYTATPSAAGTYCYRAEVQRGSCDIAHADSAVITVEGVSRWTGVIDTTWNISGNWNVCGIPIITRDAVVPVVTSEFYPSVNTAGVCKSIIIETGARVRVLPIGSLTVSDDD